MNEDELRPLEGTDIHTLADKQFHDTLKDPELQKVDVPPLPESPPPVITVLERFWAWLNGYADQQIMNAAQGKTVANPFAVFSIVANWQRYAIGIGILLVIVIVGYFCLR